MKSFIKAISTGFYVGYLPGAPGTYGSVVGAIFYFFVWRWLPPITALITLLALFFLSVWASDKAITIFNEDDPKKVVIDEIVGMLVTYLIHPYSLKVLITGFILFRLFDILKPFPIRRSEYFFPRGWGVVMDDVLAGVYANVAMWGIFYIF